MPGLEVMKSPEVAESAVKTLETTLELAREGAVREVLIFYVVRDRGFLSYTAIESRYEIAGRLMEMANEVLMGEEV